MIDCYIIQEQKFIMNDNYTMLNIHIVPEIEENRQQNYNFDKLSI